MLREFICKLHVPISIRDTGPRDFETEQWDRVSARRELQPDQAPQAAAVNRPEEDVRLKDTRGRLRKPPVVVQELARRFEEIILRVLLLHRGRHGLFGQSLTGCCFV